ncbi:hypothetical protein ACL07V_35860 [Streptomyces sp. MB22_4]|uniref:hypothetical protein n=1 Tax=Streptomyces sp. MB22_4 TaxID=3383120 RepID=UPI00399F759C
MGQHTAIVARGLVIETATTAASVKDLPPVVELAWVRQTPSGPLVRQPFPAAALWPAPEQHAGPDLCLSALGWHVEYFRRPLRAQRPTSGRVCRVCGMMATMRSGVGGGFRRWWPWRRHDGSALSEIEAEITAFGEALDVHSFSPGQPGATDEMRAELARALDAYDQAKRDVAGDRSRADTLGVLRTLDEGRHALACLDALVAGRPLPERMPLCFFDARHGRATRQVGWAPPGGAARSIAVCAADAVRLTENPSPGTPRQPGAGSGVRTRPRDATPRPTTRTSVSPPQVGGKVGSGEQTHRLKMPSYRPAVMVFSTDGRSRVHLRIEGSRKGRSSRLYRLSGDGTPFTARIPLPEGNKTISFRVFGAGEQESWTATAAPLREVPRFHDDIDGTGSDVVHYRGEPGPGVLRYAGSSLIRLEALDDRLAYWATVIEGRAGEHTFQWPGRGYYQVRSAGAWSLSAT